MGRQAYMARLAFGRSAFEPPEAETQSASRDAPSAQDTEGSSQTLDPGDAASGDVQQYDDRGHPINPRSRELARQLRRAKNDVLAAAGVVVRKIPVYRDGTAGEAGSRRVSQDDYDAESKALMFASWMAIVLRVSGTWWISSLRDRFLTFGVPADLPFTDILRRNYHHMGFYHFFFGGLPAQLLSLVISPWGLWPQYVIILLDQLVITSTLSRRAVRAYLKSVPWIERTIVFSLELLAAPLIVYATYQRLGLLPSKPLFPPLRGLIPFTQVSPIQALPFPSRMSAAVLYTWAASILESPLVLSLIWRHASNVVQNAIREPFVAYICKPDRPDEHTIKETTERRNSYRSMLTKPPSFWRSFVRGTLSFVGWTAYEPVSQAFLTQSLDSRHDDAVTSPQPERQATALAAPGSPRGLQELPNTDTRHEGTAVAQEQDTLNEREHGEYPPTAQDVPEVAMAGLPPIPTSSHCRRSRPRHRVTPFSEEPAMMLDTVLSGCITELILLPLRAVILGNMVKGFTGNPGLARQEIRAPFAPWNGGMSSVVGLRALGSAASKVALCYAIELLIGLGVWGCEWALVTSVGRRYFNWGKL